MINRAATDEDDAERLLLERIRAGDKSACAQCIERYSPMLYRLALRLTGDASTAEDVVQETFLNAFKAIGSFEGRSSLSTWLYRIAANTALMHVRRVQPLMVSVDEVTTDEDQPVPQALFDWCCLPERDFETAETRAELERAIRELPEKLRVVFALRELEGLSTEATAEALGVSPDVVKTRLHRARLWLRERLSPYFMERALTREEG